MTADNKRSFTLKEMEALDYFSSLKSKYEQQRKPLERDWEQARAAYGLTDKLDTMYNGRAKIQSPILKWKVNGIVARINKVLFNVQPIGRIEDKKVGSVDETIVDLWNKYIFDNQLDEIGFKDSFKSFIKNKAIEGTSVAKITQEYEEKELAFFENLEAEPVITKDNTYFRNLLLTEFYSDSSKEDINESQACIHSAVVSMEDLIRDRKRIDVFEVDNEEGEVFEEREEVGFYKNLDLLQLDGSSITEEQQEYLQSLGLNESQSDSFQKSLQEIRKTGFVRIDECYGRFDLDGDGISEEVICTIADGRVVIRLEPTPFKHKRFVRPFIVGRYEIVPNSLYGRSNVISALGLLQELNASRSQATDAKTRAISHMYYFDQTKQIKWNGTWTPNGVISGQGPNGITPIINPNLSNVSITDSELIARDINNLFSLSPVQEGTSDSRLVPKTARATVEIISQNDMPLNDIIDSTIEKELKPFIEMLFERNLTFKTIDDLLAVWDEEKLSKIGQGIEMTDLLFTFNVKILGNLELSNEVAHQNGWIQFGQAAANNPAIAKRVDWTVYAEKILESFGIKDDSEGIFLDPEIVAETDQANEEARAAEVEAIQEKEAKDILFGRAEKKFDTELKTESDLVKMQAEAAIEKATGQKIQ